MKKNILLIIITFLLFYNSNVFAFDNIGNNESFLNNIAKGPGPVGTCPNNENFCSDKYDLTKSYIFLDNKNEDISSNITLVYGGSTGDDMIFTINNNSYDIIWLYNTKNGFLYVPENTLKSEINNYIRFNQKADSFEIQYEPVNNDTDYVNSNDKIVISDGEEIVKTFNIDFEVVVESISIVSDKDVLDLRYDSDDLYLDYVINPDNNSYCGDLTWTSSDPTVAEVYDGHVSIMGRGVTTITLSTDEGISDTLLLTIKDPRVNGVSLESHDLYKDIADDDFYLNLIIDCDDDPEYIVQYYVNNKFSNTFTSNELDIDANAKVHLKNPGTVNFDIRVYDVYYKAYYYFYSLSIHVTARMTGIDVLDKITLNINDSASQNYSYNVDYSPSNTTDTKEYVLSSSDSSVVDVDNENKKLIAKKRGTATITATTNVGFSDSTVVNVIDPRILSINCEEKYVLDINDDPVPINPVIEKQDFIGLTTIKYKNWSGSDSSAYISYDYIYPRRIGITDYSIRVYYPKNLLYGGEATCSGGECYVEKHFMIEVTSKITDFNIKDERFFLHSGDSKKIEYDVLPVDTTDDKTITWTSGDENVAIVEDGNIVGVNPGTTTITGTTVNGRLDSIEVVVLNNVESISLSETTINMSVDEKKKIQVSYEPSENIDLVVNWTSSNENVVKVDNGGNITAIKPGTVTVTAKSVDGPSATCKVTVARISINKIGFKTLSNKVYTGKQIKQDIYAIYKGSRLKQNVDYKLTFGKNVSTGMAWVKATFIGNYIGTKTLYFYIVPKKVSIKKPKSLSKKTATIYYNKTTGATGYQIAYKKKGAKKWSFAYSTGSKKKITKLKSKKYYYFEVRAYKTVNNKKYFGAWSNIKSLKIK